MKNAWFLLFVLLTIVPNSILAQQQFAGGSFSGSFQNASSIPAYRNLAQVSFSGYGYASISENFFIGGFGEGFGGQDTTSGYGGLALGLLFNRGETVWYVLNFAGIGLLGYQNNPRLGMIEEATLNYGRYLSNEFLFSLYIGVNIQANISGDPFREYSSLAPIIGARIDFGTYSSILERK
jgi:hypothetical protein